MKFLSKIKKIIISIGIAIISIPKKVFAVAVNPSDIVQDLYGPPSAVLYGVPSPVNPTWNISKLFVIPLALIIGLIIYFKKSKSTVKKKIIITILVIMITVAIYLIGDKIHYEMYSIKS